MPSRSNGIKPAAHIVVIVPEVRVVVVHHIAEEAVEIVKPSSARMVFGFKPKVPFANERGVVIPFA